MIKRDFLILKFSVISFILFVLIGYVFISSIRPSLENFVISERKNDTVVSINKAANGFLTEADFAHPPQTPLEINRMAHFWDHASARGNVQTFIIDKNGMIIYSNKPEFMGSSLTNNSAIRFVIEKNRSIARFENVSFNEQEKLGLKEVFIEAVPITFGGSDKVVGAVYTISRVGLLRKHIAETQSRQAIQIIYGFSALYFILLIIVWGADKTIHSQREELSSYAKTLERKVEERTEELKESTERQLQQAEELSKIKDEFIFVASHELRSPATTIIGNAEILEKDPLIQKLPARTREPIEDLKRAGDRLRVLVNDLLDVARLEYGSIKLNLRLIDVWSVISDSLKEIKEFADSRNVKLEVEEGFLKSLPKIMADSDRLKEVFDNLLSNAVKYNKPNGSVSITGGHLNGESGLVAVDAEKSNQMMAIHIKDTGIGLSSEELKNVFTKFWRASLDVDGTGLGLWITRQLVNKMNGEITIDSQKGEGSTFTVWFHTGAL